ncbi:hypothetical protein BAY61_27535 [Prauserella marina]|uniref:Uncharacterized protein n=1 Tax=Prauserella marina TaxID=530584 RepID=A0A222W0Z9_9PSEU|nr:hypothetical protein [Prauserella marina]ASR39712.1 hypothetical protein BAY61_27535 [Prauserella marina]PWV78696.1 hypothetical protein DES30_104433 [Prauserella marina]SDC91712.1 hypothetical protein SAMN05421630_104432 [Prauserella marina]
MLKKLGIVTATTAAGLVMFGGMASATGGTHHGGDIEQFGQVGLVNLNNTDVLHNVNVPVGVCGNDVNVLGVQVPIRDALNGIGVPVLSPGENTAASSSPYNCSSGTIVDGGSVQDN